ncbi:MAG: RnfABCDGE type electron transport complex subunit D [Clostridiales bacterium]|nr:RnfABCDGE type electron transport complex subunit D [Clostridiales bacterium]
MSQLTVAASPHIRSGNSTTKIMLDVIIALCPALIAGAIVFGWRALLVVAVCVLSCVVFEYLSRRVMKRDNTIGDLSAVVTGMLLAFNLPVTIPLWMAVIGCFIAIVIVKQLFGGIGQNFANPAITARIVLMISFTSQMTHWVEPFFYQNAGVDAVATATPLTMISTPDKLPSLLEMFLGAKGGCIGEVSGLALLIGGLYLVIKRVISPTVPLVFLGTVFVLCALFDAQPVYQLLSGGLMLGAIFMATDYSTSPITEWGKVIFGFGCGFITVMIRVFGSYPEGVSFSILFMNILVPYIDKATASRPVGRKKQPKPAK